jgi:hypothetical protein
MIYHEHGHRGMWATISMEALERSPDIVAPEAVEEEP